ncbi:MAG: hypothetical protein J0L73_20210 [Verrucomicrobia bacterium]|nr:hypothetical protein [Verrucomicrobiota bacterium]
MNHLIPTTLLLTCLLCSVTLGQTAPSGPVAKAAPEVQLAGKLEQRIAIGGETTGWALRTGEKQRVELLLPPEAFGWIQDGQFVSVSGVHGTKNYPERGAVAVFIVKKISPVVH